jgi:hypothetical protein
LLGHGEGSCFRAMSYQLSAMSYQLSAIREVVDKHLDRWRCTTDS